MKVFRFFITITALVFLAHTLVQAQGLHGDYADFLRNRADMLKNNIHAIQNSPDELNKLTNADEVLASWEHLARANQHKATVFETVKKLFDTVDSHSPEIKKEKHSIQYLHQPFIETIEDRLQPDSIFGTMSLLNITAHAHSQTTFDEIHSMVKNFFEQAAANPAVLIALKTDLAELNKKALNVFISGNIAQWIKFAQLPPQSRFNKWFATSAAIAGTIIMPYLLTTASVTAVGIGNSLVSSITPSCVASLVPTLPFSGAFSRVSQSAPLQYASSFYNKFLPVSYLNAIGLSLTGDGNEYQRAASGKLSSDMLYFFNILAETITKCKVSLPAEISNKLDIPATLSPTWETITKMLKALQVIGNIDAALSITIKLASRQAIPVNITTNRPSHNELSAGLTKLGITCGCTNLPMQWHDAMKSLIITPDSVTITEEHLKTLLTNIVLSQTLGIVLVDQNYPQEVTALEMPLISSQGISIMTKTRYLLNQKQETLSGISIMAFGELLPSPN